MHFEAQELVRRIEDRAVVDGLSLTLGPGETVVVQGPSGAGKTVLLRLLAWLDAPDAGRITLDGRTPDAWGAPLWRRNVCYVAQRPAVMPGTPADHLLAVAALASQRGREVDDARSLAERWGLAAEAWQRPWQLLSGGEQQRAALAVAVARRPEVLLLDEPTAALDPDAVAAVEADLDPLQVIWVTHDRQQAERVGTRVLELSP